MNELSERGIEWSVWQEGGWHIGEIAGGDVARFLSQGRVNSFSVYDTAEVSAGIDHGKCDDITLREAMNHLVKRRARQQWLRDQLHGVADAQVVHEVRASAVEECRFHAGAA